MRALPRFAAIAFAFLALASRALTAVVPVTVATSQNHRGWRDAVVVRNATVDVVIVPSIGRVMQLRFVGETDGPFWENENLAGRPMPQTPWTVAHGSFGGDKTWPAPQSFWNWPPPTAFDAAPHDVRIEADGTVILTSPIDPRLGLRAVRRISLDLTAPVMRIATTYEKTSGEPVSVSVWVISQLRDPVAVFMPVPPASAFPEGAAPTWKGPARFLQRETGWMRITRDPAASHKTGNDGSVLVWAGERQLLRIDAPGPARTDYPHGGCSVEVYTNADPVPYVELETLGPLQTLRSGERLTATNTYHLARRTAAPLEVDVRALLAR